MGRALMWTYMKDITSELLFNCLMSLGTHYIKNLGFLHL